MTIEAAQAPGNWGREVEAGLWLILARYGLRLLGFKRLVGTLRRGDAGRVPSPPIVDGIAHAVRRRAVREGQGCLPRAFAAAWMLQARGFRPTLHYGVRRKEGEMQAHVWLEVAGLPVVGHDEATGYALLASFPKGRG